MKIQSILEAHDTTLYHELNSSDNQAMLIIDPIASRLKLTKSLDYYAKKSVISKLRKQFADLKTFPKTPAQMKEIRCTHTGITSLEGGPERVLGDYNVGDSMHLESLHGGPRQVEGIYDASHCRLTTLEGAPSHVGGSFNIVVNYITSLEHAPSYMVGGFNFSNAQKLTSLVGVSDIVKRCDYFHFSDSNIHRGGIEFLLIDGCSGCYGSDNPVCKGYEIINKYLDKFETSETSHSESIYDCQRELIEAGFDELTEM